MKRVIAISPGRRQDAPRVAVLLFGALGLWMLGAPVLATGQVDSLAVAEDLNAKAVELYGQGQYAEAIPLMEQALAIMRRALSEQHPDYAWSLNNLALLYARVGRFEEAEPLYVEALEIMQRVLGEEHPDYARSLNNLALLYMTRAVKLYEQGRYEEAMPLMEQALAIYRHTLGEEHPDYAGSLNNLAVLYETVGRYAEAIPLMEQALAIRRRVLGEEHPDYARSLNNLAALYETVGRYEAAILLMEEALEIIRRTVGKEHPDYASSLNNLAVLYQTAGRYAEAEPLYVQAREIYRRVLGEEHPDYAMNLNNLAVLYSRTGRYVEAESLYIEALEIRRRVLGEEHPDYAMSLNNLAELYYTMGRYAEAEPLYVQARQLQRRMLGEEHPDYAMSLNNLAALYETVGRYAEAEPLYVQALAINRRVLGEEHPDYARSLHNLAGFYQTVGKYAEAEPLLEQALEIRRRVWGEQHFAYARSLHNVALLYELMGRYMEAEPLAVQALAIYRRTVGEDHPDYARSLHNLAFLYQSMGRHAEAEPMAVQALAIYRGTVGEDHPDYARGLHNLAALLMTVGRIEEALPFMDQALAVEQRNLQRVFSFSSEPAMRAYLATVSNALDALLSLALHPQASPTAQHIALDWTLRRKGILFEALLQFREVQTSLGQDPDVTRQVTRLRGLRQHLNDLQLAPPAAMAPAARQTRIDSLRATVSALESDLNRLLSARRGEDPSAGEKPSEEITASVLQQQLPKRTALVEIVQFEPFDFTAIGTASPWQQARYVAFVVPGSEATPQMIDLGLAETIDDLVGELRQATRDARRDFQRGTLDEAYLEEEYHLIAEDLYKRVFAPLEAALGQATQLYISPDGELNRIPFAALVDGDRRYLIERYRIAYLASGRDLLRRSVTPGTGTVVFAGPSFDLDATERQAMLASTKIRSSGLTDRRSGAVRGMTWEALPGALAEAHEIDSMLSQSLYGPVTVYADTLALEEVFKAVATPRVLHVATHGFFLEDQDLPPEESVVEAGGDGFGAARGLARLRGTENPLMRSGLVLAGANALDASPEAEAVEDGWVTAEEIALLELRGTELVVLSACESGLGAVETGEGVHGLRRAFAYAGVETLVTSLFKVPDAETRALIGRFYEGMKAGAGKLVSLHRAQEHMIEARRQQHGAAHPFFWAGFILVGGAQ